MSDQLYESHAPIHRGPLGSIDEMLERIGELDAVLEGLLDELAANEREYVDLSHRERVTRAELERVRHYVLVRAGLDEGDE